MRRLQAHHAGRSGHRSISATRGGSVVWRSLRKMQITDNPNRNLYIGANETPHAAFIEEDDTSEKSALSRAVGFTVLDDGSRHEFILEGIDEWRRGELG